jgi:hypothetical protein
MGNLPVVPYEEPEPWVPFGGFEPLRSPAQRRRDAKLARQAEAEPEPRSGDEMDEQGGDDDGAE